MTSGVEKRRVTLERIIMTLHRTLALPAIAMLAASMLAGCGNTKDSTTSGPSASSDTMVTEDAMMSEGAMMSEDAMESEDAMMDDASMDANG